MFEAQEWGIVAVFYFLAILGTGWWYLAIVIGPLILIPLSRKIPRGLTQHYLSMTGFQPLKGYPPLYEREFYE